MRRYKLGKRARLCPHLHSTDGLNHRTGDGFMIGDACLELNANGTAKDDTFYFYSQSEECEGVSSKIYQQDEQVFHENFAVAVRAMALRIRSREQFRKLPRQRHFPVASDNQNRVQRCVPFSIPLRPKREVPVEFDRFWLRCSSRDLTTFRCQHS